MHIPRPQIPLKYITPRDCSYERYFVEIKQIVFAPSAGTILVSDHALVMLGVPERGAPVPVSVLRHCVLQAA